MISDAEGDEIVIYRVRMRDGRQTVASTKMTANAYAEMPPGSADFFIAKLGERLDGKDTPGDVETFSLSARTEGE